MNSEDVVARLDNRAGYKVVDYVEVGLPVYRLNILALVQLRKSFPPIEEFVMRTVHAGFRSVEDIGGLLGLSRATVEGTLSNLIRADLVVERNDSSVTISQDGATALQEEAHIKPISQTLAIDFDGLVRTPKWYGRHGLLTIQQIESIGLMPIRGFPPKRPTVAELNPNDVFDVLRLAAGVADDAKVLLKVRDITRYRRLFLRAILLIYRAGNDVQVGFAIDGRLSEDHEMAFIRAGGIEKLAIKQSLQMAASDLATETGKGVAGVTKKVEDDARKLKRKAAVAKFRAEVARQNIERAAGEEEKQAAERDLAIAGEDIKTAEQALQQFEVRPLAVYEHPKLLREALSTSKTRLMIISPWIRKAIVDDEFLGVLRGTLSKGVAVYFGYGIDRKGKPDDGDAEAFAKLKLLSQNFSNFSFFRLGDTHAKVLIKDREFYITTSFNWLSFKGDPKRTFREEWGTFVGIPEKVDELFDKLEKRFSVAAGGT